MQLFQAPIAGKTSDEYYTPRWVFDTLNITFDLDVAAPAGGSDTVTALAHYDIKADGLKQPWHGNVWMNPPYSQVTPWWERFKDHRNGIALLPCAKSKWYIDVWESADGIATARVEFIGGDVRFPIIFAAFGDHNVHALKAISRTR